MDFECVLSFECLSFVEPSFGESEVSDDYAIPPDAFASETSSLDIALSSGCRLTSGVNNHIVVHGSSGAATGAVLTVPLGPSSSTSTNPSGGPITNSLESSPRKESLEKAGYLTKLGGKLKTWRKRYFALKNGTLTYWKSQVSPFPRNASPCLGSTFPSRNARLSLKFLRPFLCLHSFHFLYLLRSNFLRRLGCSRVVVFLNLFELNYILLPFHLLLSFIRKLFAED
jgi:hypothetical protein